MKVGDLVLDRHSGKIRLVLRTTGMFAFLSGCPPNQVFRKIDLEVIAPG